MKQMMIFSAMMLMAFAASASPVSDTTVVVKVLEPRSVEVHESGEEVSVRVDGRKGDPGYRYEYTRKVKDVSSVERESSSLMFDLPFFSHRAQKQSKFGGVHDPDFTIGFTSALSAPAGMSNTLGSSWEIGFYPCSFTIGPQSFGPHWGMEFGFGFVWRNYRMTGHTRFAKVGDQIQLGDYPAGADIHFSRIKTFSMVVPALIEWQTKVKHLTYYVNFGPELNINTYASVKTRYSVNGQKQKEFNKNLHQVPITADLYLSAGISDVAVYMRYSPFHVLQTEYAPRFSYLTFGLSLDL